MAKNAIKKASLTGIACNFFLFIIKIMVGVMSHSQSMISDGFNSISDVFASFMTFIGQKISHPGKDNDHNFGHEKAEYIFSMFISISIFMISIKLLYDSIYGLFNSHEVIYSFNLVIVSIITIIIKFILYLYTKYLYKINPSILIKSNNLDHRNDMFLTMSVLISVILVKYNIYFVDSLVGIIIAIWFLVGGISIFKESYNVLMDIALPLEIKDKIVKLILKDKNIKYVEDLYSMAIGYNYMVVVTIAVDGKLKTYESHEIANNVEEKIKRKFSNIKEVFIHIHPL